MPPAAIGETIYQRDYRIGSALKKISDENAGMSLLVNHHDRKAQADDFVDTQLDALGRSGAGAGDEDDPLAAPCPESRCIFCRCLTAAALLACR
jgi:hypothetical protein